jgi:hypothetical protein
MKKILTIFSTVIIILFTLSIFGWMVSHIQKGDKDFGFLNEPIEFMYTFPDLFTQSVEEVKKLPATFVETPIDFSAINKLKQDVKVLVAYSDTNDSRTVALMNLRNDSVYYKWTVTNMHQEHARIENPLLLKNKSIIYSFDAASGLRRIDSLGNLIWKQDSVKHHHSMNLDKNGDVWICGFEPVYYATGMYKLNGRSVFYIDDYITKIDTGTGTILFNKSFSEILRENNLEYYIIKSNAIEDPLHINDIEPTLKTTNYYNEGDLFISSRNMSFIMQYRPSTNKVIRMIEGPFTSQHDVDIYHDSSLVFFDNNFYTNWSNNSMAPPKDSSKLQLLGDIYSTIVRYDLWNDSVSFMEQKAFSDNEIFSETEGLIDFLGDDKVFVEEQNTGILWILEGDSVLYKNVLKSQHNGYHHLPNWTRLIK